MKKIIIFILLLGILFVAVGFWYWQRGHYSKEILKLEILGPNEAETFQEVEYIVRYKNNGNIRLEEPRLIFEFPEHTMPIEGFSRRQEIGPDKLGVIYPGEERSFTFRGRIFGKEGDAKKVEAWLSYQPKNLRARYESATTFITIIKSAPVTFNFDFPSKVEAGRDFKFSLNYFSNSDYPIANLGIKVEYPFGFEFLGSNPRSLDKIQWDIPLLNRAEGGRIEIRGRLLGELRDQKIFRASLGIWFENEFISLKEAIKGVEITRPNLSVFQRINNQDQYIANPGDTLHYEIFFRNIGEEPFADLFLVARLEGEAFDFDSVRTNFGKFNKDNNSIIWDWRDVPELRSLEQGEEGKVEFWISAKENWQISASRESFVLRNSILISRVTEVFETKINSRLVLSQKGYFYDEAFGNSGPIPPKVGEKTSYTIVWQVKNYFNDLRNVKVKTTLPPNVSLTGKIWPDTETPKFTFDSESREIVWNVSNGQGLPAGTGVINQAPTIAFQVSLIPNQNQIDQIAPIINQTRINGEDQFTGVNIESVAPGINTALPDDPRVNEDTGRVVQ